MDIELVEISDFLSGFHPFDLLPRDTLDDLPEKMESSYTRRGSTVVQSGDTCRYLYIIRTGAVETHSADDQLLARLSEGESFGIHAMLNDCVAVNRITAIEDSLFYMLPFEDFERLRREFQQFAFFFAPVGAERLRDAHTHGTKADEQLNLMSVRIEDLLVREPVAVDIEQTVCEAAMRMRDNRVSCVLVTEGEKLEGILTDRDLRNRLVAENRDCGIKVADIMTRDPISLDVGAYAFDALLTMSQNNICHLPVTRDDKIAGVITNTNLLQKQTISAVYMVGDIHKQRSYEGLAEVVAQIPDVLVNLVEAGATSHNIGHIITSIADAATLRLVRLAEEKLGPPPVPYVWAASGSQARQEQTGVSDQDNCLILDNDYNEKKHGAYFAAFAKFVSDGLHACGYVYCPGEMMATTPKWRQPLAVWKKYFTKWIEQPEPKALMLSSIFFDLRAVAGEVGLFKKLQKMIRKKAKANRIFIAHMVGNALTHTPPIGFFRNFVLIRGGEHDHEFDLKHTGVVPIVDIARVYALEAGISIANTYERLMAEKKAKVLSESGARDLLDAYEFIAITRLKHQAEQNRQGRKPNNFMAPEDLSHFERNHLRDAFSVVKTIQSAMASAHSPR